MYRIGIDVGSTYVKYCVMENNFIIALFSEQTPLRQKVYFDRKLEGLTEQYPNAQIISCGYGKSNVSGIRQINELTALGKGSYFLTGENCTVLDIGGQDSKLILQEEGKVKQFFINNKCAAGSGLFLTTVLDRVGIDFSSLSLINANQPNIHLSSVCAVFAQSEIVELIADNRSEKEIIDAVIWQLFEKTKALLGKVDTNSILLSGGLCQIPGVDGYASIALNRRCIVVKNSNYLSAIGCAVSL